ncbi:MAG: glycosyltransferase family A protein [Bdellovibrionota bacterium]
MNIAVFFGVYEAERAFAAHTLGQMLEILEGHEVHVHIVDDGSESRVGAEVAARFANVPKVTISVVRYEKPLGYYRLMEKTLSAFQFIANLDASFDHIIRLDADLLFVRKDIARLFNENLLPKKGLVGISTAFRKRDFLLLLSDLLPLGFRRAQRGGKISHKWQKRTGAVWWYDLGLRAFLNGFRMNFMPGSLQIMGGDTLKALQAKGWLNRNPAFDMGLVLGEDVMTSILVKAVNHPLIPISSLLPEWKSELYLNAAQSDKQSLIDAQLFVAHPLKSDATSMALRMQFS